MDDLAKYVAGPVAVASLGLGLYTQIGVIVALPFWVLAGLWLWLGFLAWRKERFTLEERTIRLANRILQCAPGGRDQPPLRKWSAYGSKASAAKWIAEYQKRDPNKRVRKPRPYTDKVQAELATVIDEWGYKGVVVPSFERFLSERPAPSEYTWLASELVYVVSPKS